MSEEPRYYTPPVEHQDHVRKMIIWLLVFFIGLAVLVGAFVYFAPRLVVHLPIEVEQRFVKPYEELAEYLFKKYKGSSVESEAITTYLQALGGQLGKASELPKEMPLRVHFINSGDINAFATLGGHVFVCRGLLESVRDENGLAMVLGHEIAHIKNRDPVIGMSRGLALQLIYSFLTGDYGGSDLVSFGSELGLMYFSREQESKADAQALVALQRHYGHIAGYKQFFEIIGEKHYQAEEADGANEFVSDWLSSHPNLRDRIAELDRQAQSKQWEPGIATPLPEEMKDWLETLRLQARDSVRQNLQ